MNFTIFVLLASLSFVAASDLAAMKRSVCRELGFAKGGKDWQRCLSNVRKFGKTYCLAVSKC
jgi:hypothetical protein